MKKKFLLPGLLLVIVIFVILDIATVGDSHVTVVQDNATLISENGKLKNENNHLKSENSKLAQLNNKLSINLTRVMSTAKSMLATAKKPETANERLPKIIVTIEEDIESGLGWCSPDIAYSLLEEKLGKTPTKEEYKKTLLSLINKNMLFYPGLPDPYVKGNKIAKSEINNLIK